MGLDRGLADVLADERGAVDLDEMALLEQAHRAVHLREQARDRGLARARVAEEDEVLARRHLGEAVLLAARLHLEEGDERVHLLLDGLEPDERVELGLQLLERRAGIRRGRQPVGDASPRARARPSAAAGRRGGRARRGVVERLHVRTVAPGGATSRVVSARARARWRSETCSSSAGDALLERAARRGPLATRIGRRPPSRPRRRAAARGRLFVLARAGAAAEPRARARSAPRGRSARPRSGPNGCSRSVRAFSSPGVCGPRSISTARSAICGGRERGPRRADGGTWPCGSGPLASRAQPRRESCSSAARIVGSS